MMKLTLCTLILLPALAFAQIDEKKKEQALYEVLRNGETAYYTDISKHDDPFEERQCVRIANDMMEKEGIFGVELLNEFKTLRVYHLSYIDVDGLKSFVLPFTDSFHVEERVNYEF